MHPEKRIKQRHVWISGHDSGRFRFIIRNHFIESKKRKTMDHGRMETNTAVMTVWMSGSRFFR